MLWIVQEIGIGTSDSRAKEIAENLGACDIVITTQKGFTGLNYGAKTAELGVGKRFDASMLILNADAMRGDVLTQLCGRIGRYGEKVQYTFNMNAERVQGRMSELLNADVLAGFERMIESSGLS